MVNIRFPFRQVGNGKNGVHTVVSPRVNRFNKEAIHLENAQDVSVLNHTLGKAHAMVPHVIGLLIERKSVERVELHEARILRWVNVRGSYASHLKKVSLEPGGVLSWGEHLPPTPARGLPERRHSRLASPDHN